MKFLNEDQRQQIGFSFVMDELAVITPYGAEKKKEIRPFDPSEYEILREELDNTEIIINAMEKEDKIFNKVIRLLHKIKDIRNTLKRTGNLETLDEVELYEFKNTAINLQGLGECLEEMKLPISKIKLKDVGEVVKILDPGDKGLTTFYIYEEYSDKLRNIRELKGKKEKAIFASNDSETIEKLKQERLNIVIDEENEELRIRKQLTQKLS